jgi:peptidoglycan hydrolase-like protein with peptidoglycan-binding domain
MTLKDKLATLKPTAKVTAQTTVGSITGLITWLLVTTYFKSGLPVELAAALPGIIVVVWGFIAGWLKKENIVIPPLPLDTAALPSRHTAAWLADVRRPGPNGRTFFKPGEDSGLSIPALAAGNLMEDDVTTSLFTPGCAAYAGYSAGAYSNMSTVRAYAATQNARAFAFSGIASELSGADAIDMEPGLASTSDAAAAYRAGIRYFYASASSVAAVNSNLAASGIARSSYKILSAHYSGEHICGPSTCGYPQADATQWTDTYLGKSLDCTVFDATFFGSVTPPPPANPWPLSAGSTGANVVIAQRGLNKWRYPKPLLVTDGVFGALTTAAVKTAQSARKLTVTGVIDETLWKDLLVNPAPPPALFYGKPRSLAAVAIAPQTTDYTLNWSAPAAVAGVPAPTSYAVYLYDGAADAAHLVKGYPVPVLTGKVTVKGLLHGHSYIVHVVPGGDAKYIGKDVFASLTIS